MKKTILISSMKRIIIVFTAVLLTATLWSQAPQKISYQAVVRGTNNVLVTNQQVGMKISLLQGSATGNTVYEETHTPTANANGLVSIDIGGGSVVSGVFANIDWANGPYFVKTETDPAGGTSYSLTTTSQLLSVPFALYAANSQPGPKGDKGDIGEQGLEGKDGATGQKGDKGLTGDIGEQGLEGKDGATGQKGDKGLTGDKGEQGAQGSVGAIGANGLSAYQVWLNLGNMGSENDFIASLKGPQGVKGDKGETGLTGSNGTNGGIGGFTHYLGEAFNGGIIFEIYKGSDGLEHGLIVALTENSGAAWQTTGSLVNANRTEDGAYNTNLMTGSPAQTYILTLGADWYLPSIDELGKLYYNRYYAQKGLRAGGNTLLSSTIEYWSSSEIDANIAHTFNYHYGTTNYFDKDKTNFVRAIRAF